MTTLWEINPHLALGRSESAAVQPCRIERALARIEKILGHSLDGDFNRDGYSLDIVGDWLMDGLSVNDCVEEITERKKIAAAGGCQP